MLRKPSRVIGIVGTMYKPDIEEQGIIDVCVVFHDASIEISSILEGSRASTVAQELRKLADKIEGHHG